MLNNLLGRISKIAMEILNSVLPLYQDEQWDYLLVAQPNETLNQKIIEEKISFSNKYAYEPSLEAKPYLSIAGFTAKDRMEETLIRWIQNICNLQNSFTVTFNNYGVFPPDTIYLRVQDELPFKRLANALKILDGFIQSNDCAPLNLVARPHLTIAGRLPQYIYDTAIKEYSQKTFHESFTVDKLILFKRDAYMKCHLINTFILPPPVNAFD
jgi:2'-5' RNA ligase